MSSADLIFSESHLSICTNVLRDADQHNTAAQDKRTVFSNVPKAIRFDCHLIVELFYYVTIWSSHLLTWPFLSLTNVNLISILARCSIVADSPAIK